MGNEKEIKKALRKLEYGVYVVTLGKGEEGNAFTASWISQVSSEPPMVAVSIHNKHQSARLLKDQDSFVVNLLPESGATVARTYYGPAESGYEKLKAKGITEAPGTGTAMLTSASGYLDCRIVERVKAGNHTLYVGEIVAGEITDDGPLLTSTNSNLHYTG